MKSLNDEALKRIQQIKDRLKKTTPGKWYVNYLDDSYSMNLVAVSTRPDTGRHEELPSEDPTGEIRNSIIATTLYQADFEPTKPFVNFDFDEFNEIETEKGGRWDEDAEFIASAKDDIEFLIGLIEGNEIEF